MRPETTQNPQGGNVRLHLTAHDEDTIRKLTREIGVLQAVDGHRLDRTQGSITITCSDADHFPDIFREEATLVTSQCQSARVHTFGWNGGPLRLAVHGMSRRPLGRMLFRGLRPMLAHLGVGIVDPFEEVAAAKRMKGIDVVSLYAHAPCGYAYAEEWDIGAVIDRLILAKTNLKAVIPNLKLACYLRVRHENGSSETFFVARADWANYRKRGTLPEAAMPQTA